MKNIEIKVLPALPAVRAITDDPALSEDIYTDACNIATQVYSKHLGLEHLAGKLRLSVYFPTPVSYVEADGVERQGFGMLVGPAKKKPVLTVLIPLDGTLSPMVSMNTSSWLNQFGEGRLPSLMEEIDLDSL